MVHNHVVRYLHAVLECAEVLDLCTKQQVAQLRVGEEDDEEHYREPCNVLGALKRKRQEFES